MIIDYAILFAFPPLALFYFLVGLVYNPSKWRKYIPAFFFFLFIIICAFTLKHGTNKDLIRYYESLYLAKQLTLPEISQFFDDGLYVMHFIYWGLGRLGVPQLLPALSITIVMLSVTYITCDLAEHYNSVKSIKFVLLFQLLLLPFMYVMETVRSGMALALIILLAYLDIVKEEKNLFVFIGYLACIFIHHSAIFLILFRIACSLPEKIKKVLLFFPVLTMPTIYYLQEIIYRFNLVQYQFFVKLSSKALNYSTNEYTAYGLAAENSLYFLLLKTTMSVEAVLMLIIVFYLLKSGIIEEQRQRSFLYFFSLINLFVLAIVPMPVPLYWRFAAAGYACCGAYMMPVRKHYKCLPLAIKIVYLSLWLCTIPSLVFQIRWTYTYIDSILDWGADILLTNMYTVLFEILTNIL